MHACTELMCCVWQTSEKRGRSPEEGSSTLPRYTFSQQARSTVINQVRREMLLVCSSGFLASGQEKVLFSRLRVLSSGIQGWVASSAWRCGLGSPTDRRYHCSQPGLLMACLSDHTLSFPGQLELRCAANALHIFIHTRSSFPPFTISQPQVLYPLTRPRASTADPHPGSTSRRAQR